MNIYDKITKLCELKGISLTELCQKLGISRSSLTELNKGRCVSPKFSTVASMANYFKVPLSYFEENNNETLLESMTNEQRKLLFLIDGMAEEDLKLILSFAERLKK